MNTFNAAGANPNGSPTPVINDQHFAPVSGVHPSITLPDSDDAFDFTTGECRIARIVKGVCFDTRQSVLAASVGTIDVARGYTLKRLYRAPSGDWFVVRLEWWNTFGLWYDDFIKPIPGDAVLDVARALVPDKDCRRFLLEWYCDTWIPRCDACARRWAEHSLSGEDRETVLAAIARLPPEFRRDRN